MRGKWCTYPPIYQREALLPQSHLDPQCPLDVCNHLLQTPPIILVWSLYSRGEKIHRHLKIPIYSSPSEQKMWQGVIELWNLLFRQGSSIFLILNLEKILSWWRGISRGDFIWEFVKRVFHVWRHWYLYLSLGWAVKSHTEVVMAYGVAEGNEVRYGKASCQIQGACGNTRLQSEGVTWIK